MKMKSKMKGKEVWKKISGTSRRHSGLEVHKYDCGPHNDNLLASLFPNGFCERI